MHPLLAMTMMPGENGWYYGALVGKLETLSQCRCVSDVGGGMVDYVTTEEFMPGEDFRHPHDIEIGPIRLLRKTGGKRDFQRPTTRKKN